MNVFAYEMAHEDDTSPVTITIHSDRTIDYDSQKNGKWSQVSKERGAVANQTRRSGPMLQARLSVAAQDIPDHGMARVVRPTEN